jgi:hypothetical protein
MVLIIAGLERMALSIFAAIATVWFPYLLISLWSGSRLDWRRGHSVGRSA